MSARAAVKRLRRRHKIIVYVSLIGCFLSLSLATVANLLPLVVYLLVGPMLFLTGWSLFVSDSEERSTRPFLMYLGGFVVCRHVHETET